MIGRIRVAASDVPNSLRLLLPVLGKASMSILNGWFHHLVGGWSPLIGQVRSAYGPQHKVWGSSTGSAVAVSAGMCPVAIGVDSNGSIVRDSFALHASIGPLTLQTAPADRAGILGFRPTHGLISAEGIIPIKWAPSLPPI